MIRQLIIILSILLPFNVFSKPEKDIIYLPIVFHVLYEHHEEQIPISQIQQLLKGLNSEYNSDSENLHHGVRKIFHKVTGNPKIEFVISNVKASNYITYGINQKKISSKNYSKENIELIKKDSLNGMLPWNTDKNINVWICHIKSMNSNHIRYSGITTSIQNSSNKVPGIVLDFRDIYNANVLIHEMGHFLGLPHTWGGFKNTCNSDDGFSDTPNCRGPALHCKNPEQICDTIQQWENWMDYSLCPAMFTIQQCDKMHQIINENTPKMLKKGTSIHSNPSAVFGFKWPESNLSEYPSIPTIILNTQNSIHLLNTSILNEIHIKGKKKNKIQFLQQEKQTNHLRDLYVSIYQVTDSQESNTPIYFSPLNEKTLYQLKRGNYIIYYHQNPNPSTRVITGVLTYLYIH
jgi:hypothetical protein